MTSIAVVHMDMESRGGGEAVAMAVLEALQPDHSLTLITLSRPDIDELNAFFDTNVDPDSLEIRLAGKLGPLLHRVAGVQCYHLQNALLARYARRRSGEFDTMISTINELGLPPGSIEYVHFPFDWAGRLTNRDDIFHPSVSNGSLYSRLCERIADVDGSTLGSNQVFANSRWTAEVFEHAYDERAEILFPPIDTRGFEPLPWEDREPGFVTIGRIERSKRIHRIIDLIDKLRSRGHRVHLHIVGPSYDPKYRDEIQAMADQRSYVELEGSVSRKRLARLASRHKFGIHGKEHEHFGMAVAELMAGGAITFVPASGGQCEIVGDEEMVRFETFSDALEKADRVLREPELMDQLRPDPKRIDALYGRDRFQQRIRAAVDRRLADQPL